LSHKRYAGGHLYQPATGDNVNKPELAQLLKITAVCWRKEEQMKIK